MSHLFRHIILGILANALALFVVQYFLKDSGFLIEPEIKGFILVGFALGLLNTFVRPMLKLISLPFVILSLGLFLIVINAIILGIVEYLFNTTFQQSLGVTFHVGGGIFSYFLAAFLLSVFNSLTHWILKTK
ncbi:phage holin family protein [Candidatus Peregrinibacteria bacterium]|nr:phage holin family protein [Candidatus Peregrinibacteria bacterium]